MWFLQSQYPRLVVEDFLPLPCKGNAGKDGWYVSYVSISKWFYLAYSRLESSNIVLDAMLNFYFIFIFFNFFFNYFFGYCFMLPHKAPICILLIHVQCYCLCFICYSLWILHSLFLCDLNVFRYPPGHGDVFPALMNSGKLDALLSKVCKFMALYSFIRVNFWNFSLVDCFLKLLSIKTDCRARSMSLLPIRITWVLWLI